MNYSFPSPKRVSSCDERDILDNTCSSLSSAEYVPKPDKDRLSQCYSFHSNEALSEDHTIDDKSQVVANMKMIMMKQQEQLGSLSSKLRQSHERRRTSVESLTDGQSGNFPMKLYEMLKMADTQTFGASSDAVAWLHHGRAFKILDEQVFMASIVPMFFKQTKIRSFYRQLNLWGFKKVTSGKDIWAWYHENFIRGEPLAIMKMERTKIKRASSQRSVESHGNAEMADVLTSNMKTARDILADIVESMSLNQTSAAEKKSKEFDLSIISKIRREVASAFKVGNVKPDHVSSNYEVQM